MRGCVGHLLPRLLHFYWICTGWHKLCAPRDGLASLTLSFAWVVPLGLAARPVAWVLVDERLLAAATGASFSSCSRTHLPWHVSHSIVPWVPCLVVLTARASRWPTLAVGLVVWLIIVDWQLGAAPIVATSTSFYCCSSFHPTWCASLLLAIRFTCPRSTTGLPAGYACGINLVARLYRWPILGVGLAAYPVAWLLGFGQMLGAAPVVAWFHLLWHASLALVLWLTCPRSATGLLASSMCGAVLAARPLRWQILGVEFAACPTAWLLVFEWFGSLARPPSWLFTCPSVCPGSNGTNASAPDPVVPIEDASVARTPPAPAAASVADNPHDSSVPSETADLVDDAVDDASPVPDASELAAARSNPDEAPYDPMVHIETSDMLEEALEISRDCVLLADLTGVIQANGEDLVHESIPEATDSIIREVTASILGASTSPDAAVVPSRPAPTSSAPAGLRRATMPMVLEHHEFDEWCAAQSRTPLVAAHNQPAVARASSIPPMRPHKRQASSSDPSRAKRSQHSTSSSTRIPSVPKAGISSVNNSPAETARQSRREK
ncbi:hypothetical protein V6N13_083075 [Hibiscus sabdariffa]